MTMTETHVDRNELAEMTPAEFVGLIRTECMKPGRGMYDTPLSQWARKWIHHHTSTSTIH